MEIDLGRAIPLPILEVQEMEAKGMPIELVLCPLCGVEPVREQQEVMLGKIQDGGYPVLQGRLVCPECDFGQTWGQSYCIGSPWDRKRDWRVNIVVWNRLAKMEEQHEQNDKI